MERVPFTISIHHSYLTTDEFGKLVEMLFGLLDAKATSELVSEDVLRIYIGEPGLVRTSVDIEVLDPAYLKQNILGLVVKVPMADIKGQPHEIAQYLCRLLDPHVYSCYLTRSSKPCELVIQDYIEEDVIKIEIK